MLGDAWDKEKESKRTRGEASWLPLGKDRVTRVRGTCSMTPSPL